MRIHTGYRIDKIFFVWGRNDLNAGTRRNQTSNYDNINEWEEYKTTEKDKMAKKDSSAQKTSADDFTTDLITALNTSYVPPHWI